MTKICILYVEDRAGIQTLVTKILYGLVTKIALVTVCEAENGTNPQQTVT